MTAGYVSNAKNVTITIIFLYSSLELVIPGLLKYFSSYLYHFRLRQRSQATCHIAPLAGEGFIRIAGAEAEPRA